MQLYSLQSISITVNNAPKKDINLTKRTANALNYIKWFEIAKLADCLRFSSLEISSVLQNDPVKILVEEAFCALISPKKGRLSEDNTQKLTKVIRGFLAELEIASYKISTLCATVFSARVLLLKRYSVSLDERIDDIDYNYLFLNIIHAPVSKYQNRGRGLSSFFIKRYRYLAFLGLVDLSNIFVSFVTNILGVTYNGSYLTVNQREPIKLINNQAQAVNKLIASSKLPSSLYRSEDIAMQLV